MSSYEVPDESEIRTQPAFFILLKIDANNICLSCFSKFSNCFEHSGCNFEANIPTYK